MGHLKMPEIGDPTKKSHDLNEMEPAANAERAKQPEHRPICRRCHWVRQPVDASPTDNGTKDQLAGRSPLIGRQKRSGVMR